jgi:amino acid permease
MPPKCIFQYLVFSSIHLLTAEQMFSILNEISDNSHYRTTSVVFASIGSASSVYILVAVAGYLSFGNAIGGNIVSMYLPSASATIGRAAIVVLVMFSYPLQIHPCRASVDAVMKWRWKSKPSHNNDLSPYRSPLLPRASRASPETMSDIRFAAITSIIVTMTFITAMTVTSLETVLAYVGSTGSTSISFILPGLFYYKISSPESATHQCLMKESDEADDDVSDDGVETEHGQGLLSGSGLLSSSGILAGSSRSCRKALLRKLSFALAMYGVLIMVACLITNTFFLTSK